MNYKLFLSLLFILLLTVSFSFVLVKSENFQSDFCDSNIGDCVFNIDNNGLEINEEMEENHLEKIRIRDDPYNYHKKRDNIPKIEKTI